MGTLTEIQTYLRLLYAKFGERIRPQYADRGHTLYLLDEPTSGLHPGDSRRLMLLLIKLVEKGNSVVVIEHSLNLISQSDWVIDMGPEGGQQGGCLIAEKSPESINKISRIYTGRYL